MQQDLEFIISQLLSETKLKTPVEEKKSDLLPQPPVIPENIQKVSLSEYMNKKKELNDLLNQQSKEDLQEADQESVDSFSSSSSESSESELEEGEEINELVEEEVEEEKVKEVPRTKNEVAQLPPVPPPAVVQIPTELEMKEIGEIFSIQNEMVLIKSFELPQPIALDIGSILAFEDRSVLGEVDDTFGPVQQPFYLVRFNNQSEMDLQRIQKGVRVFQCPSFSKVIYTEMLKKMKGTDASNIFDEEVPEEEQEFSDDEQEQMAKQKKKKQKAVNKPKPINHFHQQAAHSQPMPPVMQPPNPFAPYPYPQPTFYGYPVYQPVPYYTPEQMAQWNEQFYHLQRQQLQRQQQQQHKQ